VLTKIYRGNITRLAGDAPRPLDVGRAIAECTRIGAIAQGMSNTPAEDTEAVLVARKLEALA